jgi:hypothetical protein
MIDMPKHPIECYRSDEREWWYACHLHAAKEELKALREAAEKVTCARCMGSGLKYPQIAQGYSADPCPDCADLRALLNPPA